MENYYQLYLDSAQMYALGYWLLFAASVIVPWLILRVLIKYGKFGSDGLPVDTNTGVGFAVFAVSMVMGILLGVNAVLNAIPATFVPALWSLSKVTGCE